MKNKNIFKIYLAATLATGFAFTACSDDDNESTVAPEVNITHGATNIAQGTSLQFTATVNDPAARLSWYLNGHLEAEYAPYTFEATELGIQEVVLTATNDLGTSSDTLFLNVHKATAGQVTSINDIVNWTGEEGSNRAVLAIQWVTPNETDLLNPADENIRFRAWGYRWDESEEKTSVDMVKAIAQNDPHFFAVLTESDWGISATGFIYDADGDGNFEISNAAHTLTQADFTNGIYMNTPDGDFDNIIVSDGDYWIGGFMNTFLCSWNLDSSEEVSTNITESQFMMNQRVLGNNSWDAWTWSWYDQENPYNPSPLLQLLEAAE